MVRQPQAASLGGHDVGVRHLSRGDGCLRGRRDPAACPASHRPRQPGAALPPAGPGPLLGHRQAQRPVPSPATDHRRGQRVRRVRPQRGGQRGHRGVRSVGRLPDRRRADRVLPCRHAAYPHHLVSPCAPHPSAPRHPHRRRGFRQGRRLRPGQCADLGHRRGGHIHLAGVPSASPTRYCWASSSPSSIWCPSWDRPSPASSSPRSP